MLTGEKTLLRTDLFYDVGRSLNPAVDIGQVWLLRTGLIQAIQAFMEAHWSRAIAHA